MKSKIVFFPKNGRKLNRMYLVTLNKMSVLDIFSRIFNDIHYKLLIFLIKVLCYFLGTIFPGKYKKNINLLSAEIFHY